MTVNKALEIIDKIIEIYLKAYEENSSNYSTKRQGDETGISTVSVLTKISLHFLTQEDKLFYLDMAIKEIALKTIPIKLIEGSDSTSEIYKNINNNFFIRTPNYPKVGENLDIDKSLSYGVIYLALGNMYVDFNDYSRKALSLIDNYSKSSKKKILEIINQTETESTSFVNVKFSTNNEDWHDNYQDGDIYISFKRVDTGDWTDGIKFVGEKGQDGEACSDTNFSSLKDTPDSYSGNANKILSVNADENAIEFIEPDSSGSSTFLDLTDTPEEYTAGKYLAINSAGDAIEEVDAPSGSTRGSTIIDGSLDASGTINLDLYDTSKSTRWYFELSDDTTLVFNENSDTDSEDVQGLAGSIYVFQIAGNGYNLTFDDNISKQGDFSIDASKTTVITCFYDGYDFISISNVQY